MITYVTCRRCGRRLNTKESMAIGYGPHCLKVIMKFSGKKQRTLMDFIKELHD